MPGALAKTSATSDRRISSYRQSVAARDRKGRGISPSPRERLDRRPTRRAQLRNPADIQDSSTQTATKKPLSAAPAQPGEVAEYILAELSQDDVVPTRTYVFDTYVLVGTTSDDNDDGPRSLCVCCYAVLFNNLRDQNNPSFQRGPACKKDHGRCAPPR